jgi:HD-like signal output (HDOD) protein
MNMSKHILFVDSEKYYLNAIRRSFRIDKDEWTLSLAKDAVAALRIILDKHVDILVTETTLPGMDGIELLELVRLRFPYITRIILSGHVDRDVVLKSIGIAHQYLAKPCDDAELKATINRAYLMRRFLPDEDLKSVVSRIGALPSLPRLYVEVNNELNSKDPSIAKVADIVSKDVSVAAKLLQLVNSPFFGIPNTITQPQKAVSLLGLDLVQAVVLASGVFAAFKEVVNAGFSVNDLWNHSYQTGAMAKVIAQLEHAAAPLPECAYMAGLLHDIGSVLLAAQLPEAYVAAVKLAAANNISIYLAEKEILGISHAELGAYLLGLWGLSDSIIIATAYHHKPSNANIAKITALTFVHIANELAHADAKAAVEDLVGLDWEYLRKLQLATSAKEWLNILSENTAAPV